VRALALVVVLAVALVALAPPGQAAGDDLVRASFPAGTAVIPMDEKQADRLAAYGLVHALLRAGVPVHRVVTPPNPFFKTEGDWAGQEYAGGPFLVWPSYRSTFDSVRANYTGVSTDRLRELYIVRNVFAIVKPTAILVVKGYNPVTGLEVDYGRTEVTLDRMGIPYDSVNISAIEATPNRIFNYDLVVADCPAWYPQGIPNSVVVPLRLFVEEGGSLVFTDQALFTLGQVFPGVVRVSLGWYQGWVVNATIHSDSGILGQFYGQAAVTVRNEAPNSAVVTAVPPDATVLMDTAEFPAGFSGERVYRILAANFTWGNGTVEVFAYHPADQPPASFDYTAALYGNIFVHSTPLLLPQLPATPPGLLAGGPLAPPPNVPPPPPPPSLALPSSPSLGYLFAGFAAVGMTEMIRGKVKLRRRERIAVRV